MAEIGRGLLRPGPWKSDWIGRSDVVSVGSSRRMQIRWCLVVPFSERRSRSGTLREWSGMESMIGLMDSSIPTWAQSSRATIPFTGSFTLIWHRKWTKYYKHLSFSLYYPPFFPRLLHLVPCVSPPPCGECLPCSSRSTCRSNRIVGGGS